MPAAARTLLFALCALAAPAYLQAAIDLCSVDTTASASTFSLTVEPPNYKENTEYNVTVKGHATADNFEAVQLQALDTSKTANFGNWTKEAETSDCPGGNLLHNTTGNSFTAKWRSPNIPAATVEIKAYIKENGELKFIAKSLTQATTSPTESTKVTGTTKHPANDTSHDTHTTHPTEKQPTKTELTTKPTHTTTGGSNSGAYSSSILIAIVQSIYLLFILGKQ